MGENMIKFLFYYHFKNLTIKSKRIKKYIFIKSSTCNKLGKLVIL